MKQQTTKTFSEPRLPKDQVLKTTLKSKNTVEQFIALKKMDSLNEKIDKQAVERAHSWRQCRNPSKCDEKHVEKK